MDRLARKPRQQPADAAERIQRLARALGTGPHAASFNPTLHLRHVLQAIGDKDALDELGDDDLVTK